MPQRALAKGASFKSDSSPTTESSFRELVARPASKRSELRGERSLSTPTSEPRSLAGDDPLEEEHANAASGASDRTLQAIHHQAMLGAMTSAEEPAGSVVLPLTKDDSVPKGAEAADTIATSADSSASVDSGLAEVSLSTTADQPANLPSTFAIPSADDTGGVPNRDEGSPQPESLDSSLFTEMPGTDSQSVPPTRPLDDQGNQGENTSQQSEAESAQTSGTGSDPQSPSTLINGRGEPKAETVQAEQPTAAARRPIGEPDGGNSDMSPQSSEPRADSPYAAVGKNVPWQSTGGAGVATVSLATGIRNIVPIISPPAKPASIPAPMELKAEVQSDIPQQLQADASSTSPVLESASEDSPDSRDQAFSTVEYGPRGVRLEGRGTSPTYSDPGFLSPADRAKLVNQVAGAFSTAIERGGEVSLRLRPPELGNLHVALRLQDGTLSARLEVESTETKRLLLEKLPSLRERLAEHQIKIEQIQVDVMNQQNSHFAHHPHDRSGRQQDDAAFAAANRRDAPAENITANPEDKQVLLSSGQYAPWIVDRINVLV